MTPTTSTASDRAPQPLKTSGRTGLVDTAFAGFTLLFGLLAVGLIAWIGVGLYGESALTRARLGWGFVTGSTWDVPHGVFGAAPFIYGTIVSSAIAIAIAAPLGIGAALFLSELAPRWLASPVSFVLELLAAIPSVIYGLWGFQVLCPWMQAYLNPWLEARFGSLPAFAGPSIMTNMLAAGVILAIMILPLITSVSRELLLSVPASLREASLGLGATHWETSSRVVLRAAWSGLVGVVMLALGRAVGETMAVVMVVGNTVQTSASLLQPGYTMPALLANEFNEAFSDPAHRSVLIEIALILFVITLVINGAARLLIAVTARRAGAAAPRRTGPAGEAIGRIARLAPRVLLGLVLAWLIVSDVRSRGAVGLAGPVGIATAIGLALWAVRAFMLRAPGTWRRWRSIQGGVMGAVLALSAVLACFVLGVLLAYVSVKGLRVVSASFLTELPHPPTDTVTGGIANGITGTIMLVAIAAAIGVPVGLLGGVFLSEFSRGRLGGAIRFAADVLNGVPSVVIGMFAYTAFVLPVGHFSALAGGAALAVMMIPTVMRTTEEMLRLVPQSLREASLGLGAGRARTIVSIVLPAARAGITTGVMLALARVAGETAPLLFTAFGSEQINWDPRQPSSSVTMLIYRYAGSAYPSWVSQAWGGALVLLVMVLLVSVAARIVTRGRATTR